MDEFRRTKKAAADAAAASVAWGCYAARTPRSAVTLNRSDALGKLRAAFHVLVGEQRRAFIAGIKAVPDRQIKTTPFHAIMQGVAASINTHAWPPEEDDDDDWVREAIAAGFISETPDPANVKQCEDPDYDWVEDAISQGFFQR